MNRSVLIALGILVGLFLYMLTGLVGCTKAEEAPVEPVTPDAVRMTVKVREMKAREIPREVSLTGKTQPSRSVEIKAETAGRILSVAAHRGSTITQGGIIAEIELNDRPERLEQARASLDQARFEYEAALRLQEQGLRPASQVAQVLAELRGAEQRLRFLEIDVENTRLEAPFDGILQDRMVEVGDYLGVGDPVALVIDLDPLIVVGNATEFDIEVLHAGEHGFARLSDGQTLEGRLRYVAGEADPLSRTFRVELEVDNPGNRIPAGITAQVAVETDRVKAYSISPALISISDAGEFGIKTVDDTNTVQFYKADIVKTDPMAIWLTGLPEKIRIITVGQGFTQPGDKVNVELESTTWE